MQRYLKILKKFKGKTAGIFVDEANLFYSQKELGWHVHWQKVLEFFEKFYERNVLIKNRLEKEGFEVVTKPLKKIYLDKQKKNFILKCNFDVEITRDVIRNLSKIDLVLLASSDSDFIGLRDDVISYKKGFIFVCFEHNVAWEIRKSYHLFFEDIQDKVQYKQASFSQARNKKPRK